MFIITLQGHEDSVYSVKNEDNEQVLYLFVEEDDAVRFAMMLEDDRNYPPMHVVEVDDDAILSACKHHDYEYSIFTSNDFVIPPEENYDSF
jgi:hypothetical protein